MLNQTGKPQPRFYVLGRGRVLLAENDASTQLPSAYRHLGNAPAFATTLEVEEFTHQSSLTGFSEVDARAITSREIGVSFSLDEITFQNLALFYNGVADTIVNPAVAGVGALASEISITLSGLSTFWYQLLTSYDGQGSPMSLDPVTPGLTLQDATTMTTLVEGTDYDLDAVNGMVFILEGSPNFIDGNELDFFVDPSAMAPATIDRVEALKGQNVNYSLKFININPLSNDEETMYEFHNVSLAADGDLQLIQENEASVASFSGAALRNPSIGSGSGSTVTITALPTS